MNAATEEARTLLARMERLEKQIRWVSALAVVLTLLCAAVLAWQFAPLDSLVEARGFILRDARLQTRAELRVRRDGSPVLRLNNRTGRQGASLSLREDGSVSLRLFDSAEQERAELRLDEHGTPALSLSGSNGRARVTLAAEETGDLGTQRIVLRDRMGRAVWTAPPDSS